MWWAPAIQAGLSLFGAGRSRSAAAAAQQLADLNAKAQLAETAESVRRMRAEHERIEGGARAMAAGSGFSQIAGEGQSAYISSMVSEHARQRKWTKEAGRRQANLIRRGGQVAAKQARADSIGMFAQAVSQAGQAWYMWKNPA